MRWTAKQRRQVYEHLAAINSGFDQARTAVRAFPGFGHDRTEIDRLDELIAEARAATLSYLTNVIETVETDEAGRLQNRRLTRERREDQAQK
jgi:hypothetical protein